MSEMTQEEALRTADALAGQALKETEARCSLLARLPAPLESPWGTV